MCCRQYSLTISPDADAKPQHNIYVLQRLARAGGGVTDGGALHFREGSGTRQLWSGL